MEQVYIPSPPPPPLIKKGEGANRRAHKYPVPRRRGGKRDQARAPRPGGRRHRSRAKKTFIPAAPKKQAIEKKKQST